MAAPSHIKEKTTGKTPFSFRQRGRSFRYAFWGIKFMVTTQHNFWIHLTAAFGVILAGFLFRISFAEWISIVFAIGLVLSAETFNSAIEQLTDLAHPAMSAKAGRVKDLAAGAVFIAALAAATIGVLIFAPKIFALL